jgi:predicted RNA-binding protein with TRAM domain
VNGKVYIDGRPLAEGAVMFVPDDKKDNKAQVSAQGTVKDGSFTLTSNSATHSKPGAPPGWYKVTINTNPPMGTGSGNVPKDEPMKAKLDLKGVSKGTPIATKYTSFENTPLSIEVKEGGTYELKAESK